MDNKAGESSQQEWYAHAGWISNQMSTEDMQYILAK